MALAGGLGLALDLSPAMAHSEAHARTHDVPPLANMLGQLFAESNTRFLCEIPNESAAEFENLFGNQAVCLGSVSDSQHVEIKCGDYKIALPIADIKQAWQKPLDWN